MKNHHQIKNVNLFFSCWKNTNWAVFSSLKKNVVIGVLALSYFTMLQFNVNAQNDTTQMDEVQIISSRNTEIYSQSARIVYIISGDDIKEMPVNSLADLLQNISSLDVRQRGNSDVQSDISISGGTFDQTLILINGIKMSDSQTGHHSMNIPLSIEYIERIEILEGPGSRVFGINAYSGAINIITNYSENQGVEISSFYGRNNYFGANISADFNIGKLNNFISSDYSSSDGYTNSNGINNNDFKIFKLFGQSSISTKIADFSGQAGFVDKSFGANSFYSPKYPWQYENTQTFFGSFNINKKFNNLKVSNSAFWRRNYDRFELFREEKFVHQESYFIDGQDTAKFVPGVFAAWNYYSGHNFHVTDIIGDELKFSLNSILGRTTFGAEYRYENILSNVLGETLETHVAVENYDNAFYTKRKTRENYNFYFEHFKQFRKLSFSLGISANYNKDYNWNYSGGIDLSYSLSPNIKLFSSVNQGVRLPTFTDLYYDGPSNKGNPNLKPENSLTFEAGTKFITKNLNAHISYFKRYGNNTIDWVRLSDTIDWQPMNITNITTQGANFFLQYKFKNLFVNNVSLSYSYIDMTKTDGEYISKYVFDYLKHKAVFSLNHKILKNLNASWIVNYENREGSFSLFDLAMFSYIGEQNYEAFFIADVKLFYQYKNFEFFVEANNLFNKKYFDIENVEMQGRIIKAGLKLKFY